MRTTNERKFKKEEASKEKNYRKKERMREKGITLIALVVTIIILLILAGVTLNIALSDNGLFNKAKKAADDYEQAQSGEEDLISQFATQMYSEYVGAIVEGYTISSNPDGCTVEATITGDTDKTFMVSETQSWRVWDYDGNTLRIIGDPTTDTLTLKGIAGYNNGVWAMDHICNTLYSNGKTGVSATNLKRTDIQKVSTYDYTKYKHESEGWEDLVGDSSADVIHFGETKTYNNGNTKYPNMWNKYDKNWTYEYSKDEGIIGEDKECKKWEEIGEEKDRMDSIVNNGSDSTIFKQSYYAHDYKQNEFINNEYYNLIFRKSNGDLTGGFWIEGRNVTLREEMCAFGLDSGAAGSKSIVAGDQMYNSKRR